MHIVCPRCQATNRVPDDRRHDGPSCGRCGAALLDGQPAELSDASFDAVVGRSELPVLVDFWAPWCGPCRQMAPQFEQAAQRLKGRVRLAKVNTDENPALATRFGIRSIPTLVRLERGRETGRDSGALPAARIVALAESR